MGIEQNKQGVYVPDKETKWPSMRDEERSKVYKSHKEKYAGTMAKYKIERDEAKKDYWDEVNSYDYRNEFAATDPKLKGMPVSMALLLTFKKAYNNNKYDIEFAGKEKSMMLYSLNYLQNAPENIALRREKYPNGNIDKVPKGGFVKIEQEGYRWQLKIQDKDHKTLFAGFMFPDE